jgi:allantoin racemase
VHVRIVTPVIGAGTAVLESLDRYASPGTLLSQSVISHGPASIESMVEEALAVPGTLEQIVAAAADGVDAVVIDCMADPGLGSARELVDIPVIGAGHAAMHVAHMLGHKFSIVTALDSLVSLLEEKVAAYGLAGSLASVRSFDVPVLELCAAGERMIGPVAAQAARAIDCDGAHVIVLGCTGLKGLADQVADELRGEFPGVPVIDPLAAALKMAEALVGLGVSHSRRSYVAAQAKASQLLEANEGLVQ